MNDADCYPPETCLQRRHWELDLLALPEEAAGLRRTLRHRLALWGLPDVADDAQLCASELITNVIRHVGVGVPTTLSVSMRGPRLRLELRDPGKGSVPVLAKPGPDEEAGRGLILVGARAADWGVVLHDAGKTTWVELIATGASASQP